MGYAKGTSVSTERSRAELEKMLRGAGSTSLMVGNDGDHIIIGFQLQMRTVRLTMAVPTIEDIQKTKDIRRRWSTSKRAYITPTERVREMRNDEERRLWRVLVLVVKAKLEAIAQGLSDVEHEFLADVVIKGGRTVGEHLRGELERIYSGGDAPRLLLGAHTGD